MGLTRAVIPATGSDKGEFPNLPENIQTTEPAYHAEFRMEMLHSFSFDADGISFSFFDDTIDDKL